MAAPLTICTALAAKVAAVTNGMGTFTGYDVWPEDIHPPAVLVKPTTNEALTMDYSAMTERFLVEVLFHPAVLDVAQRETLRAMASSGAASVAAALLADSTLNGSVDCVVGVRRTYYGGIAVHGEEFIGARWEVEVIA